MTMYARITRLDFKVEDRSGVHELWNSVQMGVIAGQAGFRGSLVFTAASGDQPWIQAVTLWDKEEDFTSFYEGDHRALNEPIVNAGMQVVDRHAAELIATTLPAPSHVRTVRLQLAAEESATVLKFWRKRGKRIVETFAGNLGAWALYEADVHALTLVLAWRSAEAAEAFRTSDVHSREFAPGLGEDTSLIELRDAEVVL